MPKLGAITSAAVHTVQLFVARLSSSTPDATTNEMSPATMSRPIRSASHPVNSTKGALISAVTVRTSAPSTSSKPFQTITGTK